MRILSGIAHSLLLFVVGAVPAFAEPDADQATRLKESSPVTEPLKRMRDYFLNTPTIEFTTSFVNDTDMPGLSNRGTTHFIVRHPNSFRIEMKSSKGHYIFISDGQMLTVYRPDMQRFARTEARDSIVGTIYLVAGLFSTQARLIDFLWTVDYGRDVDVTAFGTESVGDKKCARYRVSRFEDNWDAWLDQSDASLPCRVRSTGRDANDRSVQTYDFRWVTEPKVSSDVFDFTPPAGTREARVSDLK